MKFHCSWVKIIIDDNYDGAGISAHVDGSPHFGGSSVFGDGGVGVEDCCGLFVDRVAALIFENGVWYWLRAVIGYGVERPRRRE